MRIICDENVRTGIFAILGQEGHDTVRVQDELELGFNDGDIVDYACETGRVVLTNDDDFLGMDHCGVLFVDEQRTPPREVLEAVERVELHYDTTEIHGGEIHVPDGWT